jgi:hypothetical protein
MVGISGRFTAGDFLLTAIALVAGLWSGCLSVVVGTIIAYTVNSPTFFGLDFLPALTNVLLAGLVLSNRLRAARAIYLIVWLAFLVSPYSLLFGYSYVPYVWVHTAALIVLLSPLAAKVLSWVRRNDSHQIAAVATLAFIGTMLQHLTGGLLFEITAGFIGGISPSRFKQIWSAIFWLYPVERLVIVIFSTIITVAVVRSLNRWVT